MDGKVKVIISPQLAKFLLSRGYQIVDLKPDREQRQNSVFIFRDDDGLHEAMREFLNNKK